MSERTVLSLPEDYAILAKLRAFVREQALAMGFDGDAAESLALAVDEAATNIISHSAKDAPHVFQCTCGMDLDSHELICELVYEADDIFAPDNPPGPEDILARVQAMKRGGLGVYLVHNLVDKVEYRREGTHNIICLIKHL